MCVSQVEKEGSGQRLVRFGNEAYRMLTYTEGTGAFATLPGPSLMYGLSKIFSVPVATVSETSGLSSFATEE